MVVKIIKKGNSFEGQPITPTFKLDGGIKVVKKGAQKPLSVRDQQVVKMVAKGGKSKAKILRAVGFSEAVARNPKKVFDKPNVEIAVAEIVKRIERVRSNIVAALEGKDMDKVGPLQLAMMMNMHTKDIELLSGRPTDRTAYQLPDDEKKRLKQLLDKNKTK